MIPGVSTNLVPDRGAKDVSQIDTMVASLRRSIGVVSNWDKHFFKRSLSAQPSYSSVSSGHKDPHAEHRHTCLCNRPEQTRRPAMKKLFLQLRANDKPLLTA
jgi:hypothetical protein